MTVTCTGVGVSSGVGIAIGDAYRLHHGPVRISPSCVPKSQIGAEIKRFADAVAAAGSQLRAIRTQIPSSTPSDIIEFIDTHLLMLEDKAIAEGPIELIRDEGLSAESALQIRRDALVTVFEEMADPYLRTRKDDVDHVVGRIQKLLGAGPDEPLSDLNGRIILTEDLTPADAILLKHRGIAGFITEYGGPMSHTAILARSLNLPAIVGARGCTACLQQGESLILDARNGVILAGFDAPTLHYYQEAHRQAIENHASLERIRDLPAITRDGQQLELMANIELPEDVALALSNGASGIGLYRTEFLYMNRTNPPTEAEHFLAYQAVVEGMQGRPVTIRTLDLGADKQVEGLETLPSANPALGLRAIRLCLKEPSLFRPQVRALLRVSALGPVRIMLPMLTNVWEAMQARAIIEDCMHELEREGTHFDGSVHVGGMVEVPAAALSAAAFARHLDFFSIGTNDLIQYTLAIDRVDDEVNYLYDPAHPAVLRLIQMVISAGETAGIKVGMCGEMAGDTKFIALLVGMGLKSFSMEPNSLLAAKELIRKLSASDLRIQATAFLEQIDTVDMENQLQAFLYDT